MNGGREISCTINGRERRATVEPRTLLVDFIRDELQLTGTHVGCEHGVCGACTIIVDGAAVRSCLLFAVQARGARITTVEGLARDGELHPLQTLFLENRALQCGFCTPGMLMTAIDLVHGNPGITEQQVRVGMSATLCRCTGYEGIVNAVIAYAAQRRSEYDHG